MSRTARRSFELQVTSHGVVVVPDDLTEYRFGPVLLYASGITQGIAKLIHSAYHAGSLQKYMDEIELHRFFIVVHDTKQHRVLLINDKFCTNEVFYQYDSDTLLVTDELPRLLRAATVTPKVDPVAAYEMLFFYTICPPRTIFADIHSLPMATILEYTYGQDALSDSVLTTTCYWNIGARLSDKQNDYDALVADARAALSAHIAECTTENIGVSLSGGIDSGGLLAMVAASAGKTVSSITVGPYGPKSGDLQSARRTIEEVGTDNTEVYPEKRDLIQLPRYMKGLNQPIAAEYVFVNSLIFDTAEERSLDRLVNGSGVQMLLGNLPLSRLAYYTAWIDPYIPRFVYRTLFRLKHFTMNQQHLLLARAWRRRFMHVIGPRIADDAAYYKQFDADTLSTLERSIDVCEGGTLDQIAYMYVTHWVSYLQYRDYSALAKKYSTDIFIPFDSPKVAEVLFRTPNRFRKKNKWNKQVIRDIFKPFVSERLYRAKAKSLILPYNKWFVDDHKRFIAYLRTSAVVTELVDLDAFERDFSKLQEPGLTLFRMIGLAVWYDANYNQERLAEYEALFAEVGE